MNIRIDFETKNIRTGEDLWVEVEAEYYPPYDSFYNEMESRVPTIEIISIETEPAEFNSFSQKERDELKNFAALEIYKIVINKEYIEYDKDKENAH